MLLYAYSYTLLNKFVCMSVCTLYCTLYACLNHRDLTITFLQKCVWTLLKEWNICHHFAVSIVTLLLEIACEYPESIN